MSKTITLKNKHLELFGQVLAYSMTFSQSRLVRRFMTLIDPLLELREKSRVEICVKYAKKDKDGEPVIENGQYKFPENTQFPKYLNELYEESVSIDVPDAMTNDLQVIKTLIENSTAVLTPFEAMSIEEILETISPKPETKVKKEVVKKTKEPKI